MESPVQELLLPGVKFMACPVGTSLGVLGRKWTLLILRNIGFLKTKRFNKILQSTPGLTPLVLSMRLNELEQTGLSDVLTVPSLQIKYTGRSQKREKMYCQFY